MMLVKPTGALVMAGVAGFVGLAASADARAQCPELEHLRSVIVEARERIAKAPALERCGPYFRLSEAVKARVEYARQNIESCGISDRSLAQMEREYRDATRMRDNVCAGRPARPFPPEIIQR
jgi:hypothetical protein